MVRSRDESEGSKERRVGCDGCKIAILCVVEMIWLGPAACGASQRRMWCVAAARVVLRSIRLQQCRWKSVAVQEKGDILWGGLDGRRLLWERHGA